MARYDKDKKLDLPQNPNHIDKPKGAMSIREAASMEMEEHSTGTTVMRGKAVHGFGNGTDTSKRHGDTRPMEMRMMEVPMDTGPQPPSPGESVTRIMDMIFQLPFHAQLSVMRMMAPRVLGAMDARDLDNFLRDLRSEISRVESSEEGTGTRVTETPDIQGT
ncbi:hypothetical protein JRI60_39190 [Archangium violaceum]|uniref:hypothetical protein n=1 Tax=Archangium violaceum TaxID=83451 RepID=UPI001950B9A0|nr:hypothetical protein [Archangium violaceum]QRN95064.1 hypothetical protein JRI60_39190 [Archangium violaceum]